MVEVKKKDGALPSTAQDIQPINRSRAWENHSINSLSARSLTQSHHLGAGERQQPSRPRLFRFSTLDLPLLSIPRDASKRLDHRLHCMQTPKSKTQLHTLHTFRSRSACSLWHSCNIFDLRKLSTRRFSTILVVSLRLFQL